MSGMDLMDPLQPFLAAAQAGTIEDSKPDLSPGRAAMLITMAWLPAIVVAAALPRFVHTFDRWPAQWELPPLTLALMSVGRMGVWPIVLAGAGLVAVLAGGCAIWVQARLPGRWAVVLALAVAGLGVFLAGMAGVLGPILTAPVGK
jgi:hypothetical protein